VETEAWTARIAEAGFDVLSSQGGKRKCDSSLYHAGAEGNKRGSPVGSFQGFVWRGGWVARTTANHWTSAGAPLSAASLRRETRFPLVEAGIALVTVENTQAGNRQCRRRRSTKLRKVKTSPAGSLPPALKPLVRNQPQNRAPQPMRKVRRGSAPHDR